jgi:hypothetical protein
MSSANMIKRTSKSLTKNTTMSECSQHIYMEEK